MVRRSATPDLARAPSGLLGHEPTLRELTIPRQDVISSSQTAAVIFAAPEGKRSGLTKVAAAAGMFVMWAVFRPCLGHGRFWWVSVSFDNSWCLSTADVDQPSVESRRFVTVAYACHDIHDIITTSRYKRGIQSPNFRSWCDWKTSLLIIPS